MSKNKKSKVFIVSLIIVGIIVIWGLGFPASFETAATVANGFITSNFSWFYAVTMTAFVLFAIYIGFFSKYKDIKLGPDDSKPEYSTLSWFAMLFSAGMGIGLVFWGAAEPLNFWMAPLGAEAGSAQAAEFAMSKAFLHWGLHPWANYAVLALALAYMQFRKGKPGLISSIFIPILGEERVKGPIGMIIDILAVFATVAGVATSLGLGAMQINSGLNFLFEIPENNTVLIIIVVVVTVMFMTSAITGLDKGIKILSNVNVALCTVIGIACLLVGPTRQIFNTLIEGIGNYVRDFPHNAMAVGAYGDSGWYGGWTIFYWAWWIAWAPFTGTFIARISKGRTIKEFVAGVILAPAAASFVWFSIFGTMGMNAGTEVAGEAIQNTSTALFVVLKEYPMGAAISMLIVVLLCTFFVTSADSATFVLGMLSSNGDLNPSTRRKVVWGVLQSLLALALLLGSVNGLQMLQTISIVAAFPFAFVMIGTMMNTRKALKAEYREKLAVPKVTAD